MPSRACKSGVALRSATTVQNIHTFAKATEIDFLIWRQGTDARPILLFMKNKNRVSTEGGNPLANNPFANLNLEGLPDGPGDVPADSAPEPKTSIRGAKNKNRGRLEIRRQTAHRGGKTVTVISGFVGIGLPEKESLAKHMQKTCGVGGTVKDGNIEIQGDQREKVSAILTEAGFRPVMAGG